MAIRICRHLPPSEWYDAAAGCVGQAAASSFATWLQKADLPETRAVLDRGLPDTWWTGKRPHQVYAVLASVASAMVADNADWGLGWPVLAAAAAHGPLDVATAAADLVLRACPNREVEFRYLKPFASLFASLRGEQP